MVTSILRYQQFMMFTSTYRNFMEGGGGNGGENGRKTDKQKGQDGG